MVYDFSTCVTVVKDNFHSWQRDYVQGSWIALFQESKLIAYDTRYFQYFGLPVKISVERVSKEVKN